MSQRAADTFRGSRLPPVIPVPDSGVCPAGYGGPIGGQCFQQVQNPPGLGEVVFGGPGGIGEVVGGLNPLSGIGGLVTRIAVGALGAGLAIVGLIMIGKQVTTGAAIAQLGKTLRSSGVKVG